MLLLLPLYAGCDFSNKTFDTRITFNKNQTIPYGAYIAYHTLQQHFPDAEIYSERKQPSLWLHISYDDSNSVLIIICNYFNPSEDELNMLNTFVRNGNKVFISAASYNNVAQSFFDIQVDFKYNGMPLDAAFYTPFLRVKLDSVFQSPYVYNYPGANYSNNFRISDSSSAYRLGFSGTDTSANLLSMSYGKGTYILHSSPMTFSNFFILYKNNFTYYQKILALLGTDVNKIVWDEYFINKRQTRKSTSLLNVLLSYRNFKYAFWLAITIFLVFLYTEIKRRQRAVPVYKKPANETLNFARTVGKLYYEKGSHKDLANKLTQLFLEHVRQIYKLPVSEINETFEKRLSAKSGVETGIIKKITDYYYKINLSDNISEAELMEYYHVLENFYESGK
ncbi:MAG: DUF4350 domain-containing protein [Chitinophagaceae bacterium]|nr:DUF4350 domain-containing protein [Chitinophagaceae bacterium]